MSENPKWYKGIVVNESLKMENPVTPEMLQGALDRAEKELVPGWKEGTNQLLVERHRERVINEWKDEMLFDYLENGDILEDMDLTRAVMEVVRGKITTP